MYSELAHDIPHAGPTVRRTARKAKTPFFLTALLVGLTLTSVLPKSLASSVQIITILVALITTLFLPPSLHRARSTAIWAGIIFVYWFFLALLPNVPSIEIGVLGLRKTAFCLIGLIIATTVPIKRVRSVELTTIWILLAGTALSVVLYLFFPAVEAALVDRSAADVYTGLFGGVPRLQGIYAGPFHSVFAALILLVWGLTRFRANVILATLAIIFGLASLNLANVRTAYAALAIAVLFAALALPSASQKAKSLIIIAVAAIATLSIVHQFFPARMAFLSQIINFDEDSRFLGRLSQYSEGVSMFSQSPIWGWGAGSAGDTLERFFVSGEHVTSHNIFLKIAVEGGIIGVALWVALFVSIIRKLPRSKNTRSTAVGLVAVLIGMGLTGSALEALPLTFLLFFLVGLYLEPVRMSRPSRYSTRRTPMEAR